MTLLLSLCSLVATLVVLYCVYCIIADRDDIVARYVQKAGTAYYLWLFFSALLVGLA